MKEILRLCFVLTLIGAVCAAVMAFVDQKTKAPIEKSKPAEKMDAVKVVMPPSDNDLEKDHGHGQGRGHADGDDVLPGQEGRGRHRRGVPRRRSERLLGRIEILVGVDTAGVVTGVEIVKHAETPGLGSKIATPVFKGQFIGKSIKDPANWSVMKDGGVSSRSRGRRYRRAP